METIGEMTLEDAARKAAGNWRSWTCFVWDRAREIGDPEIWAIIYTHNRDSGLLDQSNAEVIAKALAPFTTGEDSVRSGSLAVARVSANGEDDW